MSSSCLGHFALSGAPVDLPAFAAETGAVGSFEGRYSASPHSAFALSFPPFGQESQKGWKQLQNSQGIDWALLGLQDCKARN